MIVDKSTLKTYFSKNQTKKVLHPLSFSPYSRSFKKPYQSSMKKPYDSMLNLTESTSEKPENVIFKPHRQQASLTLGNCHEITNHSEKAHYLKLKLTRMLQNRTNECSIFQIYSEVLFDISEYFPEFKDLLLAVRKGISISAIKEKDYEEFEFRKEIEGCNCEVQDVLNKERKEKSKLARKLDVLSEEYYRMKEQFEDMQKKILKYEKVIFPESSEFIKADKVLQDIRSQYSIIQKQKSCILELKRSDTKIKKLLEKCNSNGASFGQILQCNVYDN